MTSRVYATIAVALGSLLLALSLQPLYLGVLGHLADAQFPYHVLLSALAVALAGVAGSRFLVARRTLRTLESLETSPERRRVEWLAAPRKLTLALAGVWLMGGCGVSMWVIRRGIPRELIDHLVVSLNLVPALLGAAGAFFSVGELARAANRGAPSRRAPGARAA